jgi:hypothetical protein
MPITPLTVDTVPPPAQLKAELIALYRAARHTRALLKLSERIHRTQTATTPAEPGRVEPVAAHMD